MNNFISIKKSIKKSINPRLLRLYNWIKISILIYDSKHKHNIALNKAKNKEKINVLFLMIMESNWKYDLVYRAFEKEKRFNPIVVICPLINKDTSSELIFLEMKKCEIYAQKENYKYVSTWNSDSNQWRKVKEELSPDIIFFTNPHSITKKEYCIGNFSDKLTCYVPYSVRSDHLIDLAFNKPFELLTWKNFYETEIHNSIAQKHALNKGKNVIVTGYPIFDSILDFKNKKTSNKKRIIWAPHWTIEKSPLLNRSCFLTYADFFVELSEKYIDQFEFVLRPHPFLREVLNKENVWGKQKTDNYFKIWETRLNLSINIGEYIDLFVNSELMIHDSVSFLTEYLVTGNPAIFTQREEELDPPFNDFGKKCLDVHYIAQKKEELQNKIEDLLIKGIDEKSELRKDFIKTQILPYKNSANRIVNYIKTQIDQ